MIAKLKSGRVITGRLAQTFTRIGLAKSLNSEEIEEVSKPKVVKDKPVSKPKVVNKKPKNEKVS